MCFIEFVDKTNIKQWSMEIEDDQSMNYCKTCAEQHAEQVKPATTEQQQQQQQQQTHQQVGPPSQPYFHAMGMQETE
jgi:ribosome-binding protein aMBF1 (putative translation factor)